MRHNNSFKIFLAAWAVLSFCMSAMAQDRDIYFTLRHSYYSASASFIGNTSALPVKPLDSFANGSSGGFTSFSYNPSPGFWLSYESCLKESDFGAIGYGWTVGYMGMTGQRYTPALDNDSMHQHINAYYNTYKITRLPVLVTFSYHYNPISNLDLYVQAGLGADMGYALGMKHKEIVEVERKPGGYITMAEGSKWVKSKEKYPFGTFLWTAEAGVILKLTENIGVFAAGSYGPQLVRAGLVFRIRGSRWDAFYGPSERW